MKMKRLFLLSLFVLSPTILFAQDAAQLKAALDFKPMQKGVEYDEPTAEEREQCELKPYDKSGYIVLGPQKNVLRLILDTNGSGRTNQWSYFRNGIEVYRDMNTQGKGVDQYRWLNNAGTRWGVDLNGDGVIDSWKMISAEEVSQEIVEALATNDVARFLRASLSTEELKNLSLGDAKSAEIAKKIAALEAGFAEAVKATGFAEKKMEWYQFDGGVPGLVPAGDAGSKKDLVVYENATATVSDGKDVKQISVGTLVKIGDGNWRTVDVPKLYDAEQPSYTFILPADGGGRAGGTAGVNEVVTLVREYQDIQAKIPAVPAEKRPEMHTEVTLRILQIIAKAPTPQDRDLWIQQLADTIMAAAQQNEYPDGAKQLRSIYESVKKEENSELAAFIKSRQIMTDYYMDREGDDLVKQVRWLENLEEFVTEYEKTEAGIEGMMQLASYREMVGKTREDSLKWYHKVSVLAAGKPMAAKAKGAILRLTSVDKAVPFSGKDAGGNIIDIAAMKGSFVLLYFWDSRNTIDMPAVKSVADKYAAAGLKVVGVNLDADPKTMQADLARMQISWPQIYSPGGLDSPAAVYWGIPTPPLMILYGKDGTVVNPNILATAELDMIMSGLTK